MKIGDRFGYLVITKRSSTKIGKTKVGIAECLCNCGAVIEVRTSSLAAGKDNCGCLTAERVKAANAKMGLASRTPDHKVKELITTKGYIWLDDTYNGKNVTVSCQLGHQFVGELRYFSGRGVPKCKHCVSSPKVKRNMAKEHKDAVTDRLSELGYSIVGEYINSEAPVTLRCQKGHEFVIRTASVSAKTSCPSCRQEAKISKMLGVLTERGLSANDFALYKNARQKFSMTCESGHTFNSCWFAIQQGHGCHTCGGGMKVDEGRMAEVCAGLGFTFLGLTVKQGSNRQRAFVEARCQNEHEFSQRWDLFLAGHHCQVCAFSQVNRGEAGIAEFLESLGVPFQSRNRQVLGGKELDFYIPDKGIAIEYCGVYWHSTSVQIDRVGKTMAQAKMAHKAKHDQCSQLGIRLITIFEQEWLAKPGIVRSRLRVALSAPEVVIQARKCLVELCSPSEARQFMEDNHLQGSTGSSIRYKLVHAEKTIAVLTLGSPTRKHTAHVGTLELKRLAFKTGTKIIGGASRLFKAAVSNLGADAKVLSYCDLRYGTGEVYKALGFTMVSVSAPSPHHYENLGRLGYAKISHQSLAKTKNYEDYLTLYDCGHQKWIWSRSLTD